MTEYIFRTKKNNFYERIVPYLEYMSVEEPVVNGDKVHYYLQNNQEIKTEIGEDLLVRIITNNLTSITLNEMELLTKENDN